MQQISFFALHMSQLILSEKDQYNMPNFNPSRAISVDKWNFKNFIAKNQLQLQCITIGLRTTFIYDVIRNFEVICYMKRSFHRKRLYFSIIK